MLRKKSGIPRLLKKQIIVAGGASEAANENRNGKESHDCVPTISRFSSKNIHAEANAEHISGRSVSSTAKLASKIINTTAASSGRHLVTSSKESLQSNLEVVRDNSELSGVKSSSRRTSTNAEPASRLKKVAFVGGPTKVKASHCGFKGLGGLQVVPNPKSTRHSLKGVALSRANGQLKPTIHSYDNNRHNGDNELENAHDEAHDELCQSTISHETEQFETKSLNEFLEVFTEETKTLAESLNNEVINTGI